MIYNHLFLRFELAYLPPVPFYLETDKKVHFFVYITYHQEINRTSEAGISLTQNKSPAYC